MLLDPALALVISVASGSPTGIPGMSQPHFYTVNAFWRQARTLVDEPKLDG